jgi:hypothetical protein
MWAEVELKWKGELCLKKPFGPSGFRVPKPRNAGVIAALIALFTKKGPPGVEKTRVVGSEQQK